MPNELDINAETIRRLLGEGKRDEALRLLSSSYGETIYWQARRILVTHEDAQDVIQDAFIRIVKGIDSFRWQSKLSSWLYRIVANECSRFLDEKRKHIPTGDIDAQVERITSSPYVDLGEEAAIRLAAAVQTLPRKQQMVFNLRYHDNLSYEDIAEITDSTPQSAKMNYHHATLRIKELLSI